MTSAAVGVVSGAAGAATGPLANKLDVSKFSSAASIELSTAAKEVGKVMTGVALGSAGGAAIGAGTQLVSNVCSGEEWDKGL